MVGTARLFFALWPDARVRAALGAVARSAHAECGGRAAGAEKVHVTLFFLGNVERQRIPELEALAGAIRGRPFELELNSLGYWRHNRIVWAGTRASPAALADLAGTLAVALGTLGFAAEERRYVPHVTLLRNATCGPRETSLQSIRWTVDDFALVESVQTGGAARYDVLARWPLLL